LIENYNNIFDYNDDNLIHNGEHIIRRLGIEGPSSSSSQPPPPSLKIIRENYSSPASHPSSLSAIGSTTSLAQIVFLLFVVILLAFIGIVYWNKNNKKNGRKPFTKSLSSSLASFLRTITETSNTFDRNFVSNNQSGISEVKSNKKEISNKKRKKSNKNNNNHNHNNNNANDKKVEFKDDLNANGTTTTISANQTDKRSTTTTTTTTTTNGTNNDDNNNNNNTNQNVNINHVNILTSTADNNASNNVAATAVNGEFKLNSLVISDTVLGNLNIIYACIYYIF